MVKNLSMSDLELILCDWYEMDEQLPNPIFEKKEFERVSNGLWAIGEFRNYVSKQIYPETQTSIKNLREAFVCTSLGLRSLGLSRCAYGCFFFWRIVC